jgi:O-antigen ligase
LGIFLLPFVFWPTASPPYELPRVFFFLRWIEVTAILAIIQMVKLKRENLDTKLVILIIVFFVLAIASSVLGSDPLKSFTGNYYRGDGIATLSHLIVFSFLTMLFLEKKIIKTLTQVVSISALGIAVWTIVEALRLQSLEIAVSFGNPNFLAGYLLVILPFTYSLTKNSLFWKIGLTVQLISIFLTQAWAGIFLSLVFIMLIFIRWKNKYGTFLGILSGVVLAIAIWGYLSYFRPDAPVGQIVFDSRGRIFSKALLAFREKPLLGWGWANFDHAFDSVEWPIMVESDVYVDKAHSHFIEILVTTGLVGFTAYLLIILRVFYNLVRYKKYVLLTVLVMFVVHSQANIISISEEVFFWLLVGLSAKP